MLVLGIILGALSIPTMLNAYSEGRAPRFALMVVLISGTLIVLAVKGNTSGYTPSELPEVFARVFKRLMG